MNIIVYIILAILLLGIGLLGWFFLYFFNIPKLKISPNVSVTEKIKYFDDWLMELQKTNKFNGVVLIKKEGKVLLSKAYGFTNFKKDKHLTPQSSLRLASVSKQFTAVAIMILKEKGKLNYDDLVIKYINDFPYKTVTIRNLLNQTSGIPDIYINLAKKYKKEIEILTNEIAVDLLVKENKRFKALPNTTYRYSNTDYILLARIVEIISNLSFEQFMKKELFDPLKMNNTRIWNLKSEDKTFENKADDFSNIKGDGEELKPTFVDGVAGDGAVFSSIEDMSKWDEFWNENELLSQENLAEAFKMPKLKNGKISNYGFGWAITNHGMWHNGTWLGANTMFIRNTDKKISFVLLDNSSNIFFNKILQEIKNGNVLK